MESRGELVGCTVVFSAVIRDTAYEGGALMNIKGHVGLNAVGEGLGKSFRPAIKLGVFQSAPGRTAATATPDFVYAVGSNGSTAKSVLASRPSLDADGTLLSVLAFDDPSVGVLKDVAAGKPVTFAYSRGASGVDSKAVVDFSVVDINIVGDRVVRTRNNREAASFAKCNSQLLQAVK